MRINRHKSNILGGMRSTLDSADGANNGIPMATDITVPLATDITVPMATDITVPMATDITVPMATDITVPMATDITVPMAVNTTIPMATDITVPMTTDMSIPMATDITVPMTADMSIPMATDITVPMATTDITVPMAINTTVPMATDITVPITAGMSVPMLQEVASKTTNVPDTPTIDKSMYQPRKNQPIRQLDQYIPIRDPTPGTRAINFPPDDERGRPIEARIACQDMPYLNRSTGGSLLNPRCGYHTFNNPGAANANRYNIVNYTIGDFLPLLKIKDYVFFINKNEQIKFTEQNPFTTGGQNIKLLDPIYNTTIRNADKLYICNKNPTTQFCKFVEVRWKSPLSKTPLYLSDNNRFYRNIMITPGKMKQKLIPLKIGLNFNGNYDKDEYFIDLSSTKVPPGTFKIKEKDGTITEYLPRDFFKIQNISPDSQLIITGEKYIFPVYDYLKFITQLRKGDEFAPPENTVYNLPDYFISKELPAL
jgi:hypothetical protein